MRFWPERRRDGGFFAGSRERKRAGETPALPAEKASI